MLRPTARAALLLATLAACTSAPRVADPPAPAATAAATNPTPPGEDSRAPTYGEAREFEAVVDIDDTVGGKRFQGVWLVEDAGQRWLVRYRPDAAWEAREGKRFKVKGRPYTQHPEVQQIDAPHLAVDEISVAQ